MISNDLRRIATHFTTNAIGFVPISISPQLHQPEKKTEKQYPDTQITIIKPINSATKLGQISEFSLRTLRILTYGCVVT